MQRTRNVVMALVGVAVTATSGCVAVGPRPAQDLRPAPSATAPSSGPGDVEPQVVQSPAKEALERIVPTRTPGRDASASPGARGQAPDREGAGRSAGGDHSSASRAPGRGHGQPGEGAHGQSAPRLPASIPSVPTLSEVCALGEGYGRWPADSPQARICQGANGN
ncbi:hypothetical protein PUR57_09675 [Streptomyces sp. JV176]|uniref:hypothetical protein n=1 Tax=Streptomyces sp. JV176 TaxID=858630 RepID=UPI002E79B0C2|nr:hypothetical protein [Streptomyces sp. JV176]MEE1798937.1 hypothetical protein [Streptomyces sp. JV176]